jgi:hypothetical protein
MNRMIEQLRKNTRGNASQWGKHMPAYLIAEHIITDAAKFGEYRTKIEPLMAKHGAAT